MGRVIQRLTTTPQKSRRVLTEALSLWAARPRTNFLAESVCQIGRMDGLPSPACHGRLVVADSAVALCRHTRTDFVLQAARAAAPERCERFLQQLDARPDPDEPLRRTMSAPRPWQAG